MPTPLSSGLAAASLGLLVAGLAFRSWQVVLLALPPVIVLAVGSLFPPARPRLLAIRTLSRDRAEAGRGVDVKMVVRNDGPTLDLVEIVDVLPREFEIIHGTNQPVVSLERTGTARPVVDEPVRKGAVRGRGGRRRRTPRVVQRGGDRQSYRAVGTRGAGDRGSGARVEEPGRFHPARRGPRLGAPGVRSES